MVGQCIEDLSAGGFHFGGPIIDGSDMAEVVHGGAQPLLDATDLGVGQFAGGKKKKKRKSKKLKKSNRTRIQSRSRKSKSRSKKVYKRKSLSKKSFRKKSKKSRKSLK